MEFKDHIQILRACKIYRGNITKGTLIRQIYELIEEHKGKDFKDIDDLFKKLFPEPLVKPVQKWRNRGSRRRRESPFYNTNIQDLEEEAQE